MSRRLNPRVVSQLQRPSSPLDIDIDIEFEPEPPAPQDFPQPPAALPFPNRPNAHGENLRRFSRIFFIVCVLLSIPAALGALVALIAGMVAVAHSPDSGGLLAALVILWPSLTALVFALALIGWGYWFREANHAFADGVDGIEARRNG